MLVKINPRVKKIPPGRAMTARLSGSTELAEVRWPLIATGGGGSGKPSSSSAKQLKRVDLS